MFNALVIEQKDDNQVVSIQELDESNLPAEDVVVNVGYSSLNYKDGLAITGAGRIVRQFPMIPGIDLCGEVSESKDSRYQVGDNVILTGWGVGEGHWGGMAQKASLKADWLVPLPATLSPEKAMTIGTAGLTAMLCVQALENYGITPDNGEILVTGASGGVGSTAIVLLAALGYEVAAVTGRPSNEDYLKSLGAKRIVLRSEFEDKAKPLEKQFWAGAVDTVGSNLLAKVIAQTHYNGAVAACGLAGGFDLPSTVMPFILRNVALLGVDSVMCPYEKRVQAWQRLSELLPGSYFEQASTTVGLKDVPELADAIIKGKVTGRTLIKL
ncbi:MDR family oxidoreductase [Echinimonas agarilytica]|uniref:Oxidoreductase n=1 Tax=Echinimonas agarilytica TaxID=1215918 RepID=A0AA41W7D6_9GAMM|nr:MDR family oxidoreductase [Echinimonas agarilytica]MCM2680042.1 oxidoreductase [Echinimonas agarilytica]